MRVLVIDDDQDIREMLSLALELRWPEVTVSIAETGEEGIADFESEEPDLVILDIGLPGIDGFEVLSSIRKVSRVPVIMLTARGDDASISKAESLGANEYVTKPFSVSDLLVRARALVTR